MLFAVVLLTALAALEAAPSSSRVKRSSYGAPAYAAPSYGASQCGAYHLAPAVQHAPAGPYGGYQHALPAQYPSYMPHYRSEDFGDDFSGFQDMDHMAQMRAYGGGYDVASAAGVASAANYANLSPAPGTYGPAVGIFSGANIGGCNVPLLVSCSPSITQGRILKSAHYGGAAGAAPAVSHPLPVQTIPAYRGAETMAESHSEDGKRHEGADQHDSGPAHDNKQKKVD